MKMSTQRCHIQMVWLFALLIQSLSVFAAAEYKLGGGDSIKIGVYEQPDLSISARISQDNGSIRYPLLGEVVLGGLTTKEAGDKVAGLLKEGGFLKYPEVTVAVVEYLSQKIPIMGQVKNPGEYAIKGESRVVDLVAQAGGVQSDAADVIIVVKHENGKPVRHEIDFLKFYAGDMAQNIEVSEGDFILVPKMDTFYIYGEVRRPGSYRLERGMTTMQALSVGGGVSDRGSIRGMKVTRQTKNGESEKVRVELTDSLKPNDVLYIKERLF